MSLKCVRLSFSPQESQGPGPLRRAQGWALEALEAARHRFQHSGLLPADALGLAILFQRELAGGLWVLCAPLQSITAVQQENQLLSAPLDSALKASCDLKLVNCLEQFELDFISIKLNSGFHQPCTFPLLFSSQWPEGFCRKALGGEASRRTVPHPGSEGPVLGGFQIWNQISGLFLKRENHSNRSTFSELTHQDDLCLHL